jgi:hypothetical protein
MLKVTKRHASDTAAAFPEVKGPQELASKYLYPGDNT